MHNIKLTVAYDGTDFSGWQRQPGQPTIQGMLEGVVRQLTQQRVILYAAGRTDAGVHAWGQVVNFKTPSELTPEEFKRGGNALLPPSIRIRAAEEVGPDFHARWMAQAKTYVYSIYRGPVVPPFRCRYVLHVRQELDEPCIAKHDPAHDRDHVRRRQQLPDDLQDDRHAIQCAVRARDL